MYQKDEHFKGRIMLVDNDLLQHFMTDPANRMVNRNSPLIPKRLATEYADFADGYSPGPLMEQERQFERLWNKNKIIKRQISKESLSDIQHQKFENADTHFMCYCNDNVPADGLSKHVVECAHRDCTLRYFHKSCVKKLGVDKVSRWFCTMCEEQMRSLAYQTLRDLGYDDVPDVDEELNNSMDKIRDKFHISDGQMDQLR